MLAVGSARAADVPQSPPAPAAPVNPGASAPGLGRLLKVPPSGAYDIERRGGASRSEWRTRYRTARGDVDTARKKLDSLQAKLAGVAAESDSPWRFAPPGVSTDAESTENFTLTEQIRRQRIELEQAEKRLRDLDVEASLAGVPKDWRE